MGRKFPYIPLGLSRKFLNILLLVMLSRNFLNLNHHGNVNEKQLGRYVHTSALLSVQNKHSEFGTATYVHVDQYFQRPSLSRPIDRPHSILQIKSRLNHRRLVTSNTT